MEAFKHYYFRKYFNYWIVLTLCIFFIPLSADTYLITGANGAIGEAVVKKLAKDHDLIMLSFNEERLSVLQKHLSDTYCHEYLHLCIDFNDTDCAKKLIEFLRDKQKQIHGVLIVTPRPNFGNNLLAERSNWEEMFQSGFYGPLSVLKATIPYINQHGKIVIIAGTSSVTYLPQYAGAAVLRRMWTTLVKGLAFQLGPQTLSINALSPGVILTPFHEERISKRAEENNRTYEEQLEIETAQIPLKHYTTLDEVCNSVQFLISNQSDGITGKNIVLDEGLSDSY
ncbi:MAG: SDR family oxidoreductase [Parachlamydiales bacterium]|nr:SDR family oxidoreductase [Parachlamydiales bacterium]